MIVEKLTIKESEIKIVEEAISSTFERIPKESIIITDDNLSQHYGKYLKDRQCIVLPNGENTKNLNTIELIFEQLINYNADRHSFIVGFGGGVITDISGFAASTYMRGIRFGFISTSLLGMIDASIGGKNGVNHRMYKNIIGTFSQPEFVVTNPLFLDTLPEIEFINGMAEAVKHLLIADKERFEELYEKIKSQDQYRQDKSASFIAKQAKIKASVVNRDVKESGERKKLNFGHTFGHAIEKISGIKHGYAVSIGMVIAAKVSLMLGMLQQEDFDKITYVLDKIGLPTEHQIDTETIFDTLIKDKKKQGSDIHFIGLESIGSAKILPMDISELKEIYRRTL